MDKFGFIVVGRDGALFATLSGTTLEVVHEYSVVGHLPTIRRVRPKLASLYQEKRQKYVMMIAELATQVYIDPSTECPNISGLILAGASDFKTELIQDGLFDSRLASKVNHVCEVFSGGVMGLDHAIDLSANILADVRFVQEKVLLKKYFTEIGLQSRGKYVVGVDETLKVLETGAVETLIVWENLEIPLYVLKNRRTGEIFVKHGSNDKESDAELEVQNVTSLREWVANEYERFGCTLEFVTDKTEGGPHFCRTLGGIGGILRYQLPVHAFRELEACIGVNDIKLDSATPATSNSIAFERMGGWPITVLHAGF